jgi:chromosome segregation ATPase
LNETIAHILSHAPPSRHELSLSFQKSEVWANEADRLRGLLRQREEETSTLQERLRLQAQHHRDLMNTTLQRYREENEQLQRQIALYDQMRLEQAQMLQIVSELEEAKQQMREETQRLSAENQRLRAENQRFREGLLPQEAQRPTHAPISPDNTRRSGLPPQAAKKR